MNRAEFEALIAAIADGQDADLSALPLGSEADGLKRLQILTNAFRKAPQEPARDQRPTLFQWRHLAVKEPLGEGAFGQIYRAFDPLLRRDVALKLSKNEAEHCTIGSAVVTEARRMARLRHPNILAVHGADEDGGRVGIWSDLLDGTTLDALLLKKTRLAPQEVLGLAIPLADALHLIHRRALTHGDFKAANIMIQPDGSPVVMDFGASRDITGSASTIGSPLIMAPELFAEGEGTAAADIYAFGVLLFKMLTGHYPIRANTLEELQQKHHDRETVRFNLLPRSWRRLVAAMLSSDPQDRPDANAIRARLDSMRTEKQRLLRRMAVATVVGSLTVGLIVSSLAYREATRERDRAESTTETMIDLLQSPRPSRSGRNLRVIDLLQDFKPRLDAMLVDEPSSRARLLHELAKTFLYFDEFDEAAALSEQALAACSSCTPIELATATINYHHVLGEIDLIRLRMEAAEQHARAALTTAEQTFPRHSAQHILALAWLGRALNAQRRLDDATPYLQEAFQGVRETTWSDNTQEAFVRSSWLTNLVAREDFSAAEPIARELVVWAEEELGLRHSSTLSAHQSLNQILIRIGKTEEAQVRLQADIALANDWLGSTDFTTVSLRMQSAILASGRGRLADSISQLEGIRADILASSEPDQEALMVASGNLASRYKQDQQFDKAEALYLQVIDHVEAALGEQHPRTILNQGNLAELYFMRGQYEKALELSIHVERIAASTLGNGHSITNFSRMVQGRSRVASKQWEPGLAKLQQAADEFRGGLGPKAGPTRDAQLYLAEALAEYGDRQRALQVLNELLPESEAALGAKHETTRRIVALRDAVVESSSKGAQRQ